MLNYISKKVYNTWPRFPRFRFGGKALVRKVNKPQNRNAPLAGRQLAGKAIKVSVLRFVYIGDI
jgi:hypothetical protein